MVARRASGNMLLAMSIAPSQWIIQIAVAYLLCRHTRLRDAGLWWFFPIAGAGVAVVAIGWFIQSGWRNKQLTEESRQIAEVADETIVEDGIHQ